MYSHSDFWSAQRCFSWKNLEAASLVSLGDEVRTRWEHRHVHLSIQVIFQCYSPFHMTGGDHLDSPFDPKPVLLFETGSWSLA